MANDPLMLNKGERIVAMVEIVKMKNGKPTVVKIDGVEYAMKKGRNK
ncbi:hypothetical protein [Terribacillus saccharophilus]|nr:hypothetical protein [Terribacillus saccharophilus]